MTVLWCKECGRYLQPPRHWVKAELESKELLTFCIKRLKGLSKVRGCRRHVFWGAGASAMKTGILVQYMM